MPRRFFPSRSGELRVVPGNWYSGSSGGGGGAASCDFTYCYGGDWVQGKVGNYGLTFDGVDDHVIINNGSDIFATSKGTISMWIKPTFGGLSYPEIFTTADNSNNNTNTQLYLNSAESYRVTHLVRAGATIAVNIWGGTPIENAWNHLAITSDGTEDGSNIYLNGVNSTVNHTTDDGDWFADAPNLDKMTLGSLIYNGVAAQLFYSGSIDELAIWDVPLTPAQINLLSTGSARADSFTPPMSVEATAWGDPKLGTYSLDLDGGYITIEHPGDDGFPTGKTWDGLGSFSISVWCTQDSNLSLSVLTRRGNDGHGWTLAKDAAGNMGFGVSAMDTVSTSFTSTDTWTHFVAVYKDEDHPSVGTVSLYKDGSLVSGPSTIGSGYANTGEVAIGAQANAHGRLWDGKIDEYAVYNVQLDSGAISDLYNSGNGTVATNVSSSALMAYFNMENGPGNSTLTDRSSADTNITGTFNNLDGGTTGSLLMYYDFEIGDNNPVSGNFFALNNATSASVYDVTTAAFHPSTAHTGTMTKMSVADFGAWGQGKLGKYSFSGDGDDEYMAIASSSYLPLGGGDESFSVSFWANTSGATTSYETVIGRHDSLTTTNDLWRTGWTIQYNHGKSQTMRLSVGSYYDYTDMAYKTWSTAANTNFRHVVATYNTDTDVSQIWIDGVKGTDGTKAGGAYEAPQPGTGIVQIGGLGNIAGYSWPGSIDEVAIYNVALTDGAISDLYNSGQGAKASTVSSSALVCYLDMECDGPGSTNVLDLSGNNLSGTIINPNAGTCGAG